MRRLVVLKFQNIFVVLRLIYLRDVKILGKFVGWSMILYYFKFIGKFDPRIL